MDDCAWLKSMLASELEVRPPMSNRREEKALAGECSKLYHDGKLIAFAERRKVGSHVEISTVLVDDKHRGKGVGKELILEALAEIDAPLVLCCTKNPAMAAVLQSQGFTSIGWPGASTAIGLTVNTMLRLCSMLLRFEIKRIWVQGKGIHKYERYVLDRRQ